MFGESPGYPSAARTIVAFGSASQQENNAFPAIGCCQHPESEHRQPSFLTSLGDSPPRESPGSRPSPPPRGWVKGESALGTRTIP